MQCCANCFFSETLKGHINEEGSQGDCDFCSSENVKCVTVSDLYQYFEPIFAMYREIRYGIDFIKGDDPSKHGELLPQLIIDDWPDIFTDDFKYPQVFRMNFGFDKQFQSGWETSLEAIYTKTLNNVNYTNINSNPTVDFNWTGSPDDRPVFDRNSIDPTYSAIYVGSNTSEGSGYNFTASAEKTWTNGLNFFMAITYGDSESLNEPVLNAISLPWYCNGSSVH